MKKVFNLIVAFILLHASAGAQGLMFDYVIPQGNIESGYAARVNMFFDLNPNLEVGLVGRLASLEVQASEDEGRWSGVKTLQEYSIGVGARYYFAGDIFADHRAYVMPTIEANTMWKDDGMDVGLGIGYVYQLTPVVQLMAEVGARQKLLHYRTPYTRNNRFIPHAGIGVGFGLFGGNLRSLMNVAPSRSYTRK